MDTHDAHGPLPGPYGSPPDSRERGPEQPTGPPPQAIEGPAAVRAVRCPMCGVENRANRLFCAACGAYLRGDEDTWEELPPPGWPAGPDPAGNPATVPTRPSLPAVPIVPSPPEPAWLVSQPWDPPPPPLPDGRGERPRRSHALGVFLVLVLVLAVGGVAASVYYIYRSAGDELPTETTVSSTPSTSDAGGQGTSTTGTSEGAATTSTSTAGGTGGGALLEPTDVSASSTLPPGDSNDYDPSNLIDGDLDTAWSEGVEGAGEGEWVELEFDPPVTLTALEIANGYQKDLRRFEGNPRVLELRLQYTDGTRQNIRLYDDQGWQFITPEPILTDSLRLTIVTVYPGDTWDDASLSEIRVFGRE